MSKKQVISLVTVATMLLSGSVGVFAEETVSDTPSNVTLGETSPSSNVASDVEEASSESEDKGTIIGSDSSTVTPPKDGEGIVTEPSKPKDDTQEPKKPSESEDDGEGLVKPEQPKDNSETPENPKKDDVINQNKPTPPVVNVTPDNPIVTPKGDVIVGTKDGQVLVKDSNGNVETKSVSDIGGVTKSDGSIEVNTKSGKFTLLPTTGQDVVAGIAMSLSGLLSLAGAAVVKFKGFMG